MGKSTISMAIFNGYVSLPEGISSLESTCWLMALVDKGPRDLLLCEAVD